MWGLFDEFNKGLQDIAKEDWISFRFVALKLTIITVL